MSRLSPEAVAVVAEMERLIGEVGWTQRANARTPDGTRTLCDANAACFCLNGALVAAAKHLDQPHQVECGVEVALHAAVADVSTSFVAWNDAPGRTRDEVLALLARVKGGTHAA